MVLRTGNRWQPDKADYMTQTHRHTRADVKRGPSLRDTHVARRTAEAERRRFGEHAAHGHQRALEARARLQQRLVERTEAEARTPFGRLG